MRPLCFSGKTFRTLPADLQAAISEGRQGSRCLRPRNSNRSEDAAKLDAMEKAGKLKRIPFADRAQMKKRSSRCSKPTPKDVGADQILAKINAIK